MPRLYRLALASALLLFPAAAAADDPPAGAKPDVTLAGHNRAVASVAFSPDGKRLASVDQDGVVKIWDAEAKKESASVEFTVSRIDQVEFAPDGKSVLALGADALAVIDVATGKAKPAIAVADLAGGPTAFDVSPDGKSVAVVGHGTLRLYDLTTGKVTATYPVHADHDVAAGAFSPDGKQVATTGADRTAVVTDAATGKAAATVQLDGPGTFVLFSPDGKRLITDTANCTLRATDLAGGDGRTITDKVVPRTMALSADGKTVVIGGNARVPLVIAVADGKVADGVYDGEDDVFSAAMSADGKWLAGGSAGGSVFLWKVAK